jgi:aspartate kinase
VGAIVHLFVSDGEEVAVVTSAMHSVTNTLVEAANQASRKRKDHVRKVADDIAERHRRAAEEAIRDPDVLARTLEHLNATCDDLRNVLLGIAHIGELTPRSKDYVIGFGERLSAPLLAGVLEDLGLKARALTGGETGIVTDDNFGAAQPLMSVTTMHVKQTLDPLFDEGCTPVISGFIAQTQEGIQTTIGRGGSDFTASIIGASIRADEVWVWKDVDGLMTANPKMVDDAKMIETISFAEAMELAHFGAEVIHPKALECAAKYQLPFRVKSILDPEKEGSSIVGEV